MPEPAGGALLSNQKEMRTAMQTDVVFQPDTEEYVMPCAEAMLAGTLALMTAHAQSDNEQHGGLMARKIRSNLFFLSQHPGLSAGFRQVVVRMHAAWNGLANGKEEAERAPSGKALRVPACATLQ
jgi:hypothetical protein